MDKNYDIVVLGCGPAGLSAAINATIRNKKVIILGTEICSPPLHKAQKVDNYLGFYNVTGEELLNAFTDHADKMGIEIIAQKAEMIYELDGLYNILVGDELITAKAVIIATGIPYKLTLPEEEKFLGKGLGYCATCDGPIYKDKDVLLIGHKAEAETEANFMAEICKQVYYLPLYRKVGQLDDRILVLNGRPANVIGDDYVEGLKLRDGQEIKVQGLFILEGETAPDRLIPGLEIQDNHIKVNQKQETNLPGVYAAGDCTGPPYQVAKSVGEGQVAGLKASIYLGKNK